MPFLFKLMWQIPFDACPASIFSVSLGSMAPVLFWETMYTTKTVFYNFLVV